MSVQEAAAYAVAVYGYQLLRAIWDELRVGRAVAVETMLRPCFETADYLLACLQDEAFVEAWKGLQGGRSITAARKAAAQFIERLSVGRGREWRIARASTHRLVQSGAHVHAQSVRAVFVTDGARWALAPDGAFSREIRARAIVSARLALDLASVVRIAFAARLTSEWHASVQPLIGESNAKLQRELVALDASARGSG